MALTKCKECGNEISDAAAFCPKCGAPNTPDLYCSKCGTKLSRDLKFCTNCGEATFLVSNKDRIVAGILGICLGWLGVHYFYMGKNTAGLICILLSLVSCSLWAIVMLAQGIVILCISDSDFKAKYIDSSSTFPLF